MTVTFPGESAEYRAARNRLLEQEIELRRATEAVAAARSGIGTVTAHLPGGARQDVQAGRWQAGPDAAVRPGRTGRGS